MNKKNFKKRFYVHVFRNIHVKIAQLSHVTRSQTSRPNEAEFVPETATFRRHVKFTGVIGQIWE